MERFIYKKVNFDRYTIIQKDKEIGELLMDVDGVFRFFLPLDAKYDVESGMDFLELEEITFKLKTLNGR